LQEGQISASERQHVPGHIIPFLENESLKILYELCTTYNHFAQASYSFTRGILSKTPHTTRDRYENTIKAAFLYAYISVLSVFFDIIKENKWI